MALYGRLDSSVSGSLKEVDLAAISSTITATAVDVFVYDTRKDSDGGAWRKRTQHTSWYNETLNTATRGSRREFPAVAVIVAETRKVTIYDGDDPDLPMWMVFDGNSPDMTTNGGTNYAVTSLNGILSIGENGAIWKVHFISDRGDLHNSTRRYDYKGNIEQRNDALGYTDQETSGALVNSKVNDVAMTVLPNAPIDETTGLPVPTIAVATQGGVSVIKDDGTVVDHIDSAGGLSTQVAFTQDGKLAHSHDGHTGIRIDSLKSSNFTYGANKVARYNSEEFYINYGLIGSGWSGNAPKLNNGAFSSGGQIVPVQDNILAERANTGLNLLARDFPGSPNNNRVAYATTSYNTGWMHGDIKGAFLSDTDATNVTGSELITNGDFSSNSDWTYGSGWTISGGTLNYDGTGTLYDKAYQNITGLVVGETYVLSIDVISLSSSSISFAFATSNIGSNLSAKAVTTTGTHSITWVADRSNISVYVQTNLATQTYSVDNFSLRIAEPDRSVNNKGLQVFGTITKSAVATGADLVAYGGFPGNGATKTNYLEQPYNADFDFGTTFCFMGWIKVNASTGVDQHFFDLTNSAGANRVNIYYNHAGTDFYFNIGGVSTGSNSVSFGQWYFLVVTGQSSGCKIYLNGDLKDSNTSTFNHTHNADNVLTLGTRFQQYSGTNYGLDGSMALIRLSKSIPSGEQIKKIYEDEKVLFQENAACTLYGTSSAVTALAYDDSTSILYAGTSSGRSDFQGLRRINNTTTAVTTAMSASNGLVAEQ